MIRRGSQNTSLRSIFTNLAGLEWGNGDVSFNDKMDDFLNNVTEAQGLMQVWTDGGPPLSIILTCR
jgi:hypothetical protein